MKIFFFSFEKTKIVDFFNSITAPILGETFYSLNLRKSCPLKTVMYFTRRYVFKDDHYRANLTKWLFSSNMLIFLKYNIHYIHSSNELPCFRFFFFSDYPGSWNAIFINFDDFFIAVFNHSNKLVRIAQNRIRIESIYTISWALWRIFDAYVLRNSLLYLSFNCPFFVSEKFNKE